MVEAIGIDHIYLTVSDLGASQRRYDNVMVKALGFKKNKFPIAREPHIQYFKRQFGFLLRPSKANTEHDPCAPGLHHLCLRVGSTAEVSTVAKQLRGQGVYASEARLYPEYAPDYRATFLEDPDGIRLEGTDFRQERRDHFDHWNP